MRRQQTRLRLVTPRTSFKIPESARRAIEHVERNPELLRPVATLAVVPDAGVGTRGGPHTPLSVERADSLFSTWRADEYGSLKDLILQIAVEDGEFHADSLADLDLSERNQIGSAVRALQSSGLIESSGEHRKSSHAAGHGRRSYVYVATAAGCRAVRRVA